MTFDFSCSLSTKRKREVGRSLGQRSCSKLEKFYKNAPISPKLPSTDLPMIQFSVCYSESSRACLQRSEKARFPTDALLFFFSSDPFSRALRHMIDRKLEFQLNGRSTATQRTFPQPGIGTVSSNPKARGFLRRFDQKRRENSLTHGVEIERPRANC